MPILRSLWPRFWRDLIFTTIPASILMPAPLRPVWLSAFGARVDRSASLASGVRISGAKVAIGARTFLNRGVFIDALAPVSIGSDVAIAMGVTVVTSSHTVGPTTRRAGSGSCEPVTIGDGTWIGAGAIILPGVTISEGCIIAAGSLVNRDCEPDALYAGCPARLIRRLPQDPTAPATPDASTST